MFSKRGTYPAAGPSKLEARRAKARRLGTARAKVQSQINKLQSRIDQLEIRKGELQFKINSLAFGSQPGEYE